VSITDAAPTPRTSTVTSTDGVTLAVYEYGDPQAPAVIAVHGYPDDHHVWDGVIALLAERFHVVAYDVRGAGASSAPTGRRGYRIPQLVADLGAVIAATVPTGQIHLLAHDWGSIQSWDALTDPEIGPRIASYTSISGPSLDMAGRWLRERGHLGATAKQLAASYYVFAFQAPKLPEALIRRGLLARLVALSKKSGAHARPTGRRMDERDAVNGVELYRANFTGRMVRPRTSRVTVPVQVLAPRHDAHVTADLQCGAPAPYVDDLRTSVIEGNHWVVEQDPALIVTRFTDFIDTL
jgi:pimeloyl-ACP methyl ester carboxylesterase